MKQKIYIYGIITAIVIFAGAVLKINHLAGAGILFTAGTVTLVLLFLPVALINLYKAEGNKNNLPLFIVTWITCFVVFTAMLFKIQHWPNAGLFLIIALPFPYVVFLPVFLQVTGKNKHFNIYNTVFILLLLAGNSVFSALLSLNVTRERITESYNISANYNKLSAELDQIPGSDAKTLLNVRIDEVLGTLSEYRDLILEGEGITREQWKNNPGGLIRPDSKGIVPLAMVNSGESIPGMKLAAGLKDLINFMDVTPEYEELAKAAPGIFGAVNPASHEPDFGTHNFTDNNLAWVLIYLDGLETNLKIIKASVPISNSISGN